jgi:signal transduction histidine kinase
MAAPEPTADAPPNNASAHVPDRLDNAPRRPRLLVVDDQEITAEVLYYVFSDQYDVVIAHSGMEALACCARTPPDLILLDVLMPDMNGHDVCRRLKAMPATREIPIIFVTGFTDPAEETIGLELGAVDFISKPVNPAVVRARVRTHLKLKLQADALEQANQTLEIRIAERSAELKHAMEHLMHTEKLASLGSMVAGITHELATPLSNLRLAAASLADSVQKLTTDLSSGVLTRTGMDKFVAFCRDTTALIDRASERSEALLLSFKQVSVDQTSERRFQFDLREIVEHTLHALGPTLKTTPFEVVIDIPQRIMLDSYPGPIEQIITNLISNSLAHAFPERAAGRMFICAQVDGEQLEIIYSDDGIGIPHPIRLRIFDPFFTTKAGRGGSGLGMYTVYKLVTGLFGGSIHADERVGGGASFTLYLPHMLANQSG